MFCIYNKKYYSSYKYIIFKLSCIIFYKNQDSSKYKISIKVFTMSHNPQSSIMIEVSSNSHTNEKEPSLSEKRRTPARANTLPPRILASFCAFVASSNANWASKYVL